MVPVKLSLD